MTGRVIDAALELLDRQLIDADGIQAGKVDDLELAPDEHGDLHVVAILSGPGALAPRLGGRIPMAWRWLVQAVAAPEPRPHRWPIGVVTEIGAQVRIGVSAEHLEVNELERWVRHHVIEPLPGAHHEPPE